MAEEIAKFLIEFAKKYRKKIWLLLKQYGLYFVVWSALIILIQQKLLPYLKLESVIFSLFTIALALSYVTKKITNYCANYIKRRK